MKKSVARVGTRLRPVVGWAVVNTRCKCIDWTGWTHPLLIFTNREAAEMWQAKHSTKEREIRQIKFTPNDGVEDSARQRRYPPTLCSDSGFIDQMTVRLVAFGLILLSLAMLALKRLLQ